jgi:hypothetical protein
MKFLSEKYEKRTQNVKLFYIFELFIHRNNPLN